MGMTRRSLMRSMFAAGVVLAAPVVWLAKRTLPPQLSEAIRGRIYPGPKKHLTESDIRRPGRWKG